MADLSASDATPLSGAGSYFVTAYNPAGTLIASLDATATLRLRPQIQASIPAWAWQMLAGVRVRPRKPVRGRGQHRSTCRAGHRVWSRWRLNPYILSA